MHPPRAAGLLAPTALVMALWLLQGEGPGAVSPTPWPRGVRTGCCGPLGSGRCFSESCPPPWSAATSVLAPSGQWSQSPLSITSAARGLSCV